MTVVPLAVRSVTALVTDATAALSLGNAQPWAFRCLRDAGVLRLRLYADPQRAFPHADPENRGLRLGAAGPCC
ncbi:MULTISPECIES: hypothetical protein [unclassified Streptomyces]|uniref:hypothetical protein n=1 Tax=unclassified Streptomyces TaxID=2593676 RepID=UPI003318D998